MTIVVCHQKGGTAKSTTALMIAVVLKQAGKSFQIIDLDPQKSLTSWLSLIDLESTDEGADYTIIDTPPSVFDADTERALELADQVIVPSGTSVSDLQVTKSTLPLIEERTKGEVRVLWNRIQSNTKAGKSLGDFTETIGCKAFKTTIGLRQCYQQDFLVSGWTGLNTPAREEASTFVLEVIS